MANFQQNIAYKEYLGLQVVNLLNLPRRGTASRPTGVDLYIGSLGYNTDTGLIEWYDGSAWISNSGDTNFANTDLEATGNRVHNFNNFDFTINTLKSYSNITQNTGEISVIPTGTFEKVTLKAADISTLNGGPAMVTVDANLGMKFFKNGVEKLFINNGGGIKSAAFAGSGTRQIVVDPTGQLLTLAFAAETDPVFLASPAHSIGPTDITNWNSSFNDTIISAAFSIPSTGIKLLTMNQRDGGTITASFTDDAGITAFPVKKNNIVVGTADTLNFNTGTHIGITASMTGSQANITMDTVGFATVAASGDYNDLINRPIIPTAYTDEQAQDAVAILLAAGTHTGISFAYNDAGNALSATVASSGGLDVVKFQIGDAGKPADGATTYTDSFLVGKSIILVREGDVIFPGDTIYGYAFNSTTGVITFYPELHTGERIIIYVVDVVVSSGTPMSRVLTINGVAQDLTSDRTWTIAAGGITSLKLGENRHVTTIDQHTYPAFPSYIWNNDRSVIYQAWRDGLDHASLAKIQFMKSVDGGRHWTDSIQVNDSSTLAASADMGYYNGRIYICYSGNLISGNYTTTWFKYSDDEGATWTSAGSLGLVWGDGLAAYGQAVRLPSGKLYFSVYEVKTDGTSRIFFYQSTNNGVSWSIGPTIAESALGNVFPQYVGGMSEPFVEITEMGTLDSNTKLMCLMRSDTYVGYHYHAYSSDGGATWTNACVVANNWAFGESNASVFYGFPATLLKDGEYMYAFVGRRGAYVNTIIDDFTVRVFRAKISDVWNQVNHWGAYTTIFRGLCGYKSTYTNFGYPRGYITQTGEKRLGFYDMTISERVGVIETLRLRLLEMPVHNNYYYEAFSYTNQSIPTATETLITYNFEALDTDFFKVGSVVRIPEDGWYNVSAKLQFDDSSAGTYRTARLEAVDWGEETSTVGSDITNYAHTLLAKRTIAPSTVTEFNHVTLNGQAYLYKEMDIRVTVKHDVGSALNIVNTIKENRTSIKIKKIG